MFTFVNNSFNMSISNWYQQHAPRTISGRYIYLEHLQDILNRLARVATVSSAGCSEKGVSIPMITLGSGPRKILAWSQMHGNESTTTKALVDVLILLTTDSPFNDQVSHFLNSHTLIAIPILNPDGALRYTRENANGVDLNRDAQELSQSESRALRSVFDNTKPHLCLNLHDQRSIYGLDHGKAAAISFLSPAATANRAVTPSRKEAMAYIAKMYRALATKAAGFIGRYDDSYNPNCVGDTFQGAGVPTILFEAGHRGDDYQRERSRALVFHALLSLFGIGDEQMTSATYEEYFEIPENRKNFRDILLRNVTLGRDDNPLDIAIQYQQILKDGQIVFQPVVDDFGTLGNLHGHREIAGNGAQVLVNSQEKVHRGEIISEITDKQGVSIVNFKEI
jgi:hypothetical protein